MSDTLLELLGIDDLFETSPPSLGGLTLRFTSTWIEHGTTNLVAEIRAPGKIAKRCDFAHLVVTLKDHGHNEPYVEVRRRTTEQSTWSESSIPHKTAETIRTEVLAALRRHHGGFKAAWEAAFRANRSADYTATMRSRAEKMRRIADWLDRSAALSAELADGQYDVMPAPATPIGKRPHQVPVPHHDRLDWSWCEPQFVLVDRISRDIVGWIARDYTVVPADADLRQVCDPPRS